MIKEKFQHCPRFLLRTVKTTDSNFVTIPTLRRDDSGIEPCQVGIPTSPEKVRIPTLSRTILDSYFAQNIYILLSKQSFISENTYYRMSFFSLRPNKEDNLK